MKFVVLVHEGCLVSRLSNSSDGEKWLSETNGSPSWMLLERCVWLLLPATRLFGSGGSGGIDPALIMLGLPVVKVLEAQYENGVLRPAEKLTLRSGERVKIIVLRSPDRQRWDLARLSHTNDDEVALTKQGLSSWTTALDSED